MGDEEKKGRREGSEIPKERFFFEWTFYKSLKQKSTRG